MAARIPSRRRGEPLRRRCPLRGALHTRLRAKRSRLGAHEDFRRDAAGGRPRLELAGALTLPPAGPPRRQGLKPARGGWRALPGPPPQGGHPGGRRRGSLRRRRRREGAGPNSRVPARGLPPPWQPPRRWATPTPRPWSAWARGRCGSSGPRRARCTSPPGPNMSTAASFIWAEGRPCAAGPRLTVGIGYARV